MAQVIDLHITEMFQSGFKASWIDKVFDSMNAGLVITDNLQKDNPIIYVNKTFVEITKYSSDDVLGKNCRFLQGKDSDQIVRKRISKAIHEGKKCTELILNYKKDGSTFWNELHIAPIKNSEGVITHFVGIQHVKKVM